jgi:hypothetical protein
VVGNGRFTTNGWNFMRYAMTWETSGVWAMFLTWIDFSFLNHDHRHGMAWHPSIDFSRRLFSFWEEKMGKVLNT